VKGYLLVTIRCPRRHPVFSPDRSEPGCPGLVSGEPPHRSPRERNPKAEVGRKGQRVRPSQQADRQLRKAVTENVIRPEEPHEDGTSDLTGAALHRGQTHAIPVGPVLDLLFAGTEQADVRVVNKDRDRCAGVVASTRMRYSGSSCRSLRPDGASSPAGHA
jgi:hypothetical protein